MRDKKVVIYGAGEFGHRMLGFLRSMGIEPDWFCQTEIEERRQLEGVSILSLKKLYSVNDKLLIFVAIGNKDVSRKIKLRLKAVFLERADVIECSDFVGQLNYVNKYSKERFCVICSSGIDGFIAGSPINTEGVKLFHEHHIIGAGKRESFKCPNCGCVDRERWQLWVLSKFTSIFSDKCRVLHFAPEEHISQFIAANPDCEYYTGDIIPERAMHRTDMLDIQYKDETFDYVIMNHVLEHIEDTDTALSEVNRVLKKGGRLIISFPICTDMNTLELPGALTPNERLENYGHEDHVRLFGIDYKGIIAKAGFDVNAYTPKDYMKFEDVERYGFIEDDIVMVCKKA